MKKYLLLILLSLFSLVVIAQTKPSAGDGSFSLQIPNCIAIDIEPQHESIVKQDFFTFHLPYKKGRLIWVVKE